MKIQSHTKKPYRIWVVIAIFFLLEACKTCNCPSYSSVSASEFSNAISFISTSKKRLNY